MGKFLSLCSDCVDGVEGAARQREVSVEVAAQHGLGWTFGDRLHE